jgi:LacI family transcriptional regulator
LPADKTHEMIKVILLIDCTSEFDRKLLRGMMKYSKENGPWLFYRAPSDYHFNGNRE